MEVRLMEELLRVEAEAKYWLRLTDRSYEQTLMDELIQIVKRLSCCSVREIVHMNCSRLELLSAVLLTPTFTLCGKLEFTSRAIPKLDI
jgi:hypothetical protein